jgi:predicted  nucleic acid-binding Zn-ribbon protein
MYKFLAIITTLALLSACDQQKQASAEVGAVPKQILDKATNDINAAQALAAEKQIEIENVDEPADVLK